MHRNTIRSHTSEKISIKQLAATTVSTINTADICYNSVPLNHISSQSSVSIDPYFPTLNYDKPRRRKIFEKKYLKGNVIPQQSIQYINSSVSLNSPKNVQNYYTMQHYNDYHHQNQQQGNQDYLSFYNNRNKSKIQSSRTNQSKQEYHQQHNQNPPIFRGITQVNSVNKFSSSAMPTYNFYLQTKNKDQNNSKNKLEVYSAEQHHQRIHSSKNCSNQKVPPFANAQNYHTLSQISPIKANLFPHINPSQIQTIRKLSDIPEQVKKLKKQMLIHKKQLDQLNYKIIQRNRKTNKKEKQLLQNLIVKQKQLTQKQQQINQSLQEMAKIQMQSNSRYEQLLKNQLELQRAKRVQQLMRNNERLQKELLKNQMKFIQEVRAESRRIKNQGITMNNYRNLNQQYVSNDCIHPQNYSQHTNVDKYFGEQQNFKQISALSNKYHIDLYEMSGDNTIRQLLSPLEIKPDYDF